MLLCVILTLLAVLVVFVAQRPVPALDVLGEVAVLFGLAVEDGNRVMMLFGLKFVVNL